MKCFLIFGQWGFQVVFLQFTAFSMQLIFIFGQGLMIKILKQDHGELSFTSLKYFLQTYILTPCGLHYLTDGNSYISANNFIYLYDDSLNSIKDKISWSGFF